MLGPDCGVQGSKQKVAKNVLFCEKGGHTQRSTRISYKNTSIKIFIFINRLLLIVCLGWFDDNKCACTSSGAFNFVK